jgi:S1-C subfamily serine protease
LSPAIAEELQIASDRKGVVIYQVRHGATAARFGLAAGDVILAVNGKSVSTVSELQHALDGANGTWQITFRRHGETRTLQVE